MGSKGSNTTTTNQTQTYNANPVVAGAGTQAINMATNAANQPFNMPVAPVAGFSPDQQQAFQQYRDLQGTAQPYYNQAQGYLNSSANPLTANDINQYYNPMASNVLANLQETQGQQMGDLTGRLTQQAGGVGASRIGVGQAELARQQNLATGQTLSGLYQNALNAAQQGKQMQANAAYGMTNLGTTAQNAQLQGTGALYGAGQQQQGLQQQQQNAQYQNQLAQLAYPFQTAQYLAGITGGLSGAMGGTTSGVGTTTKPAPSIWSQVLGGLTGATGVIGATGGFGSDGWINGAMNGNNPSYGMGNGVYGGSSQAPLNGLSPSDYGEGFASGGGVEGDNGWMNSNSYIPAMQVQSKANSGAHLDLNPKQDQQSGGGDLGSSLASAAKMAAMFMSNGGLVDASNPWQRFADGGYQGETSAPISFSDRFAGDSILPPGFMAEGGDNAFNKPLSPNFNERFNSAATLGAGPDEAAIADYNRRNQPSQMQADDPNAEPIRMAGPEAMDAWRNDTANVNAENLAVANPNTATLPPNATPTGGGTGGGELPAGPSQVPIPSSAQAGLPYPDLNPGEDTSRKFAKSPWMALANAGFAMMAGTSPFAGVNIGHGLQEGMKTLEQQRKDLATEEGVNQRAKQLIQQAEFHLDQYNKMTPYQQAQVANQKERTQMMRDQMNLKGWVKGSENALTGDQTFMKPSTGEVRIIKGDGTVITGNMNDPKSFTKSSVTGIAKGDEGKEVSKEEQPPPPMGMPELASDTKPPEGAVNTSIYRKGSPALTQANAELKAQTTANVKEANLAGPQKQLLDESKGAYGVLMKDRDADGFLTKVATLPGNNFDERIRYARSLNGAAEAAGKPPPINPEKLAAMEVISKVQRTMGMMFAGNISAREAWAGQQAAIESTPGLTQSRLGMLHLISTYDAMNQYGEAKRAFFNNYVSKYGVATGWEQAFNKVNPVEKFIVRARMENLPNRQAAEKLPEAVKILRDHKNDPKVVAEFNKYYGNTASYWLTGKLDMLGAQ